MHFHRTFDDFNAVSFEHKEVGARSKLTAVSGDAVFTFSHLPFGEHLDEGTVGADYLQPGKGGLWQPEGNEGRFRERIGRYSASGC